jgi:hypothetical protein
LKLSNFHHAGSSAALKIIKFGGRTQDWHKLRSVELMELIGFADAFLCNPVAKVFAIRAISRLIAFPNLKIKRCGD